MAMKHGHAGHRGRLVARLRASGLDSFQPHEVLELLLYHVIKHRDVNALAHQMIDRFGSLDEVLSAPVERLTEVDGVGERTAEFLHAIHGAVEGYLADPPAELPHLHTLKRLVDHYRDRFLSDGRESLIMASLSGEFYLLNTTVLREAEGGNELRRAVDAALSYRAFGVALIWYRTGGELYFTREDMKFARLFADTMRAIDIMTFDCALVTRDAYTSLRKNGSLRDEGLLFRETYAFADRWLKE